MTRKTTSPTLSPASPDSRAAVDRAVTTVLYVEIAALFGALIYGAYTDIRSLYSDQEIWASIVDTWQVHAQFTLAALGGAVFMSVLSLLLAYASASALTRRLAALALVLAVLSGALVLYSHLVLTDRTTRLTGQSFGAFYGLF